ncbi:serine hydrolase, partial [Patescibacteria group bacterium]|nr:serine hydrolase [Patescibacteria group bacterium]
MIVQSDNTAYNTLLDILDRRNINLALRNIGITETVVGEKLNLDDNQFQQDLQAPGRQPNTTTAEDLTTFFDLLYNKQIAHSEEILSIFKRQKINNMIPVLLPKDIVIAHKTGEWSSIYHDSGVIFKPADPFVLSVLTNSGDPKIVSAIAKVAYLQTADSIGQGDKQNRPISEKVDSKKSNQLITLTKLPNSAEVLAAETPEKFPTITASDLGIPPKDLNPNAKEISDLGQALITPDSILYGIKKFFEEQQLKNARTSSDLVTAHLNLAKSRLAEVKRLLGQGDIKGADRLLNESENHLSLATDIAKNDPEKDLLLVKIKHVNDLHFAVLLDKAKSIPATSKGQFIDSVYNFYQRNQKDVDPVIKSSVIANPSQQKPAIGEIIEIKNNEATLKFEDGTTKQVILRAETKVRNFQQTSYQDVSSVKKGDKIAVIGLTNKQSKIIPQFILKDVPKELPNKHTGTVIEINPDENTLKIIDKQGQIQLINILDQTIIKAKDTSVSLEGIKAGSQITVFGTTNQPQVVSPVPSGSFSPSVSSTTPSPNPTNLPGSNIDNANPPSTNNQSSAKPKIIEIQAISITVTKNSSG